MAHAASDSPAAPRLDDPYDRPLTHHDLDHTPDDGNRYELIDGVLHVSAFSSSSHQNVITALLVLLSNHVRQHGLGKVFSTGLKVVLDEQTGVGPDVVFISEARLDGLAPDGYYGAPDLLIEVLSTKPALDILIKKPKYARAGVPHYWIVDPEKRILRAYQLEGGEYQLAAEAAGEATFEPSLFPGVVIPLADLWLF
jgi:Uma2 family endonuclease